MLSFYKGKKVFITGHTGFKGSWLCRILMRAGAEIMGYALEPPTNPALYDEANIGKSIKSVTGDVRNYEKLSGKMKLFAPDIVIHMAAQPLVRESYKNPRYTFETNVMGTVNLLEAVRHTPGVGSVVNVTTDKVYENIETDKGYKEEDKLDGYDPYSNSKSCSDLVTHSYRSSFFEKGPAVSTARAGNVIGGGDYAKDRIIPDCVRAMKAGERIILRNPAAVRPFQHVLEPLSAYLLIAEKQYNDRSLAGAYNVGPDMDDRYTVEELTKRFCAAWGDDASYEIRPDGGPHEASLLMLDNGKIRRTLSWAPEWNTGQAVEKTVEWEKAHFLGEDAGALMDAQIEEYFYSVGI